MQNYDSIGHELAKTNNLIVRRLNKILLNNELINISPIQISIMRYLSKQNNEPILQKDIENIFNIRRSTVSGILKTMEKNNLIIRKNIKDDSKSKEIYLTIKAFNNLKKAENTIPDIEKEAIKNIKEDEIKLFLQVLKKIQENLKEERKI